MAEIHARKIEINQIFKDFWFLIPEYQRSYVWDSDNINDLLDDLWYAYTNKRDDEYFLGSLVLKKTEEQNFNEFEVLDGQQRLTTFFIFMAVLRDIAADKDLREACHERIFQKANKYKKIPERTRLEYKIRDDVGDFVNKYLVEENGTLKTEEIKKSESRNNISIKHMSSAIQTIKNFLNKKPPEEIEGFGEFLAEKPIFISVSTESMEDAFRMFTILNNRGVPLTSADILKSINIGIIDKKLQDTYAATWEKIESDLGENFDRFLSFIRTMTVKEKARLSLLDEFNENIYKKNKLSKGKETLELIRRTKSHYNKIITFTEDISLPNNYKNLLTIMQIGLPSTDWIPALLYYFDKFEDTRITDFLQLLEYKVSSDWIIQLTPSQRIDNINSILKKIEHYNNVNDLLNDDELFSVNSGDLLKMLEGNVYGRRFARYILLKYEYLLGDNTVHLSSYNAISVEHVLPQNPDINSQWCSIFSTDQREYWTHRLANLVLISKRKNSSLSNLDFKEKNERYLNGRIDIFPSNKVFQTYSTWDLSILERRQQTMLSELIKIH